MFNQYKAFLFDLNGTMINDMPYHINAWYRILNGLGANISMEKMKDECYGKNHELLERIFPGRFCIEEKNRLSLEKERKYQRVQSGERVDCMYCCWNFECLLQLWYRIRDPNGRNGQ